MLATDLLPTTTTSQPRACRLVEWRPWPFTDRSSLLGHASVAFTGGWVVHRIPIFRGDGGGLSIGVPQAADVDAEGRVKLRPDGKRSYQAILSFEGRDPKRRWQDAIIGALLAAGIGGAA